MNTAAPFASKMAPKGRCVWRSERNGTAQFSLPCAKMLLLYHSLAMVKLEFGQTKNGIHWDIVHMSGIPGAARQLMFDPSELLGGLENCRHLFLPLGQNFSFKASMRQIHHPKTHVIEGIENQQHSPYLSMRKLLAQISSRVWR
mmetsp:Transcript_57682/g.172110  ORF Transcript_57682/g.172110 Transcript_57682/m.172110 type:complete len:144 (+) Transcript_57682:946-1377(+)